MARRRRFTSQLASLTVDPSFMGARDAVNKVCFSARANPQQLRHIHGQIGGGDDAIAELVFTEPSSPEERRDSVEEVWRSAIAALDEIDGDSEGTVRDG